MAWDFYFSSGPWTKGPAVGWLTTSGASTPEKDRGVIVFMEKNLNDEALRQKVADLEKRLRQFERGKIQKHIQEVQKRFEKIAEMGDDGIIVFDQNYGIEFANTMASELTGYAKETLVGMDFRHLLGDQDIGYLGQMHSDVGADERKRVCTEMEVLTQKGNKRYAEVCITIEKIGRGRVRTYAYIQDITERKKFERELRESEEKYRNLFERVRDGVLLAPEKDDFWIAIRRCWRCWDMRRKRSF